MGLNTTHGCWNGGYIYFNQWREAIAKAAGIPDLDAYYRKYHTDSVEQLHGLWFDVPKDRALHILLRHSDCEGYILAHHCDQLASELEALLPALDAENRELTERFIDGLRLAGEDRQNVEFH